MDKRRILLITRPGIGGAAKFVLMLTSMLDKSQFDITAISSSIEDPKYPIRLKEAGANVMVVDIARNVNPWRDMIAFFKILRIIRRGQYDVVHTHATKPGLLGRLAAAIAGVKVIYHSPHVFYFEYPISGLSKFLNIQMERFLGMFTTKVLLESPMEAKSILERKILPASKVLAIQNAIRLEEYDIQIDVPKEKVNLGIDPKMPIVGSVSRLTIQKDPFTLVHAARKVIDAIGPVKFIIVGNGNLYGSVSALVKSLGLSQHFFLTGYRPDFVKLISIFDVSVLSTICEGLPFVLLESMALRKPVVATRAPGCTDLVLNGETGYLVEPKNSQDMADKIILFLKNPELAQRFGEAGRRHVQKNFDAGHWIKAIEDVYSNSSL